MGDSRVHILRQLRQAKDDAYRSGDKALYTQTKDIRVVKRSYSEKLKKKNQFSVNDPASVWNSLKTITSFNMPSPSTEANQQPAEDLNEFYCMFKKPGLTRSDCLTTQPLNVPHFYPLLLLNLLSRSDRKMSIESSENRRIGKPKAQTVSHWPV